MHQFPLLRDLVILVALAIPVVALAHRFKIPTVVGFLLTGIAIGPHGLALIGQPESVRELAEVGVVLLLFAIGLELSLSRIIKLGRTVILGGGLQMIGTIGFVALILFLLAIPVRQGIFFGSLVALSSTAIVLKVLTERGELDSPQGRVVVAILLFQDLCVVPLMLLVPMLAGSTSTGGSPALLQIAISLAVTTALVLVGRFAVPRVLERVAGLRNREIFTLCIVVIGLGAAYVTASFGLSLALGAFLAGLVISESEYGVQAMSDILPFRDTFSGIFFTSVGMLLDLQYVIAHPVLIVGATAAVVGLKALVAGGVVRALERSLEVSVVSALGVAQVGEFSFVLADVARPLNLFAGDTYQLFLGASVMSMLATPFIMQAAAPLARRLGRLGKNLAPAATEQAADKLADHVIIVGYGLNGRNLAKALKATSISYVILEQNGRVVRQARANGEPILFGDATRAEVLERVGIHRARVIVFAISAPAEERRGVAVARHLSPEIRIVVRTRYVSELEELEKLGADDVVPEEFETSLEIFARVLRMFGIPTGTIRKEVEAARGAHYGMLRGLSLPGLAPDALRHLGVQAAIETVEVEPGSAAIGHSTISLSLREVTGCNLIAAVREGQAVHNPGGEFLFAPGDVVVMVGTTEALARALATFRKPASRDRRSGQLRLTGNFRASGSFLFHAEEPREPDR
jgi:monovalent cation:H+ antiporter-2, CPA2 family